MSSKFILYSYSIFFFIPSILLSYKTERYWEPSRRIRENGKKRGWIVKKKKHWKTSMTNKKARPGILRRHERTSRARKTREWLDATRWGREERTGCYLLAIFFHSFFLDLSLSLSLRRSLSSSPFQPNVHRERERKREIPTVEEYPRVAGQEWQREWQSGWSYTLDPEGMQRSTVERESNERVVLPRLV